jgi:hypothetical protein
MRKEIVMGTVLLLPLLAAAADFTPLGLKPGLWESTVNMKTSGSPMANIPPEQRSQMEAAMANMPPERRAQMQAMMAGRGQPTVTKVCMTKESMSKALDEQSARLRRPAAEKLPGQSGQLVLHQPAG